MSNCLNCNKECNNKFCSLECQHEYAHKQALNSYYLSPKHCICCGKELIWDQRKNKFCSKSCAVTFNNKQRSLSDTTKSKISNSLKGRNLKTRICKVCGESYTLDKDGSTKTCCSLSCREKISHNRRQYLSKETLQKLSLSGRKSVEVQGDKRRSKNEIYFYKLCTQYFSNVEHNISKFNGWDADIIINDIKYAVLWNGVWHYKQIYKNQSLEQIQNRDKIKIQEIQNCGFIPFIVQDLGKYNKSFVEKQFKLFLETINCGMTEVGIREVS